MRRADPQQADYWDGFFRGLYRGHYGHDEGLEAEQEWQVEESEQCANVGLFSLSLATALPAGPQRAQ